MRWLPIFSTERGEVRDEVTNIFVPQEILGIHCGAWMTELDAAKTVLVVPRLECTWISEVRRRGGKPVEPFVSAFCGEHRS